SKNLFLILDLLTSNGSHTSISIDQELKKDFCFVRINGCLPKTGSIEELVSVVKDEV
ncbi:MAG: hypothetical protein HOH34_03195, partial [Flavobacteriales bacterium]|nr:hypothetical protein [Flavobacteriales bacterium]